MEKFVRSAGVMLLATMLPMANADFTSLPNKTPPEMDDMSSLFLEGCEWMITQPKDLAVNFLAENGLDRADASVGGLPAGTSYEVYTNENVPGDRNRFDFLTMFAYIRVDDDPKFHACTIDFRLPGNNPESIIETASYLELTSFRPVRVSEDDRAAGVVAEFWSKESAERPATILIAQLTATDWRMVYQQAGDVDDLW